MSHTLVHCCTRLSVDMVLRWSTKIADGQYKDRELTKHTHRYHNNHLHHHPLHSQHWHDSRCRLTDPHINLFCILLTITPATPGLNIFPYFRQKYLCNKENFVKKEFLAKKLWCFDPSLRPECSFTGSEASIHNKTQPRQDYTLPRQHNHKSKHNNFKTTKTTSTQPKQENLITETQTNTQTKTTKTTIVFGRVIIKVNHYNFDLLLKKVTSKFVSMNVENIIYRHLAAIKEYVRVEDSQFDWTSFLSFVLWSSV